MDLFAFPTEVRLNIYSYLLVYSEFIRLKQQAFLLPQGPWLEERVNLCPALLRTSKQVYNEAVSLLYSDNCFHFPEGDESITEYPVGASIAFFLNNIGLLARLLRHVCVTLLDNSSSFDIQHQGIHLKNLDLIIYGCPGIRILEMSLPFTCDFPVPTASLDRIDMRLKALQSLQNVIVNVRWYGGEAEEKSHDEMGLHSDGNEWNRPEGYLAVKLRERGWTVRVTNVPLKKYVWTDADGLPRLDMDDEYIGPSGLEAWGE